MVKQGADFLNPNSANKTALDVARERHNQRAVQLFTATMGSSLLGMKWWAGSVVEGVVFILSVRMQLTVINKWIFCETEDVTPILLPTVNCVFLKDENIFNQKVLTACIIIL